MKKIALVFLLLTGAAHAQSINELYSKSIKAYKHNQYELFLTYARQLDSIRPSHPIYAYSLATAYALNAKPQEAISVLKNVISMNSAVSYADDANFTSLREMEGFKALARLKEDLEKPISTSERLVTLNEKTLHPEGVLYLKKKKQWLAGSIRKRKIVAFDIKTGKCTDWLTTDYPVFALKADADEKYLWVATSAIEHMEGYKPEMAGKGEILKVNIKTKAIENRYGVGGKHLYGDLVVSKDGVVYVSDSNNPTVYKIQDDSMVPWFSVGDRICNFQGMALNESQTKLYLADYFNGIAEIPIDDPSGKRWLKFPESAVKKGIDGIAWHDNSIIAIQNGVSPIRIIRYYFDKTGEISHFKTIDNNRPEFAEPTLPLVIDNKCYFFANCPWPAYNQKGEMDESKVQNPMLFWFKIN